MNGVCPRKTPRMHLFLKMEEGGHNQMMGGQSSSPQRYGIMPLEWPLASALYDEEEKDSLEAPHQLGASQGEAPSS